MNYTKRNKPIEQIDVLTKEDERNSDDSKMGSELEESERIVDDYMQDLIEKVINEDEEQTPQ